MDKIYEVRSASLRGGSVTNYVLADSESSARNLFSNTTSVEYCGKYDHNKTSQENKNMYGIGPNDRCSF